MNAVQASTAETVDPAVFIGGSGPDLVLLHGLGSRWQVFEPILGNLARTHRVHAFDLPGFGARPVDPTLRAGLPGFADWVTAELLARGIHSPHVVGSSMGGGVALELARRGVAGRVTVFSPISFWSSTERAWLQGFMTVLRRAAQSFPQQLASALHTKTGRRMLLAPLFGKPGRVDTDAAIADLKALAHSPGFEAARDSFTTLDAIPPSSVATVQAHAVLAWGRRDIVLPFLTQSARARRLHPRAVHIALGGAGHLPFSDRPSTCADIITGVHPFVRDARTSQEAS